MCFQALVAVAYVPQHPIEAVNELPDLPIGGIGHRDAVVVVFANPDHGLDESLQRPCDRPLEAPGHQQPDDEGNAAAQGREHHGRQQPRPKIGNPADKAEPADNAAAIENRYSDLDRAAG